METSAIRGERRGRGSSGKNFHFFGTPPQVVQHVLDNSFLSLSSPFHHPLDIFFNVFNMLNIKVLISNNTKICSDSDNYWHITQHAGGLTTIT